MKKDGLDAFLSTGLAGEFHANSVSAANSVSNFCHPKLKKCKICYWNDYLFSHFGFSVFNLQLCKETLHSGETIFHQEFNVERQGGKIAI